MNEKTGRRIVLIVGILSAIVQLAYVLLPSLPYLEQRSIVDDTYYYWVIARQFMETGRSTFDGLHLTSGYQPLWQALLTPFGALSHGLQARLSLVLAVVFYQGAGWLLFFFKTPKDRIRNSLAIGALVLWVNGRFLFEFASSGMEFGLYLFVATWAGLEATRLVMEEEGSATRYRRLILATAFLPFARVDGLGLSMILWFWVGVSTTPRHGLRRYFYGLLSLAPFVVYLLINKSIFGEFLPTSGLAKRMDQAAQLEASGVSVFSITWFAQGIVGAGKILVGNVLRFSSGYFPPGPWPRMAVIGIGGLVVLACSALGVFCFRQKRGSVPFLAIPLLVFAVVQALVYCFVIPHATEYAQWYYGPAYLGLALVVGGLLSAFSLKRVAVGGLVFLALVGGSLLVVPQPTQIATGGLRDAIAALEEAEPEAGARLGSWNAGLVAFLAPPGVHVINLDGLVNDADFARNHLGRDLRPYLRDENVTYLLDYSNSEREDNWRYAMLVRLGEAAPGSPQLVATPLYVGPNDTAPMAEPRSYHLIELDWDAE